VAPLFIDGSTSTYLFFSIESKVLRIYQTWYCYSAETEFPRL
jgi:hypothetical protein